MGNQFVRIDEKNWKRAMHCQVIINSVEPAFCVTFELDITNFLTRFVRKNIPSLLRWSIVFQFVPIKLKNFAIVSWMEMWFFMIESTPLLLTLIKTPNCSKS